MQKKNSWWKKLKSFFWRKPKKADEWEIEDFVSELDAVMQQQAQDSEEIRALHQKLESQVKDEKLS